MSKRCSSSPFTSRRPPLLAKGRSGGEWVSDAGRTNKHIQDNLLHRLLRKIMTDAERKPWNALRLRQFDGCKFRRQHPYDRYILDFVCIEKRMIVEVDGGSTQRIGFKTMNGLHS